MHSTVRAIAVLLVVLLCSAARAQVLYDAPLGTSPQSQPWLAYYSLPGLGVTNTAAGKTTYDSTAAFAEQGGFSNYTLLSTLKNPAFPTLDRTTGFTLSFDLKLLSESHSSADRAGLSVILLSSDLMGIELGFWPDKVWAQSGPDFIHAEEAAFNPTTASTTYELTIQGSNYELKANGNLILSNVLRNYSSAGLIYALPNAFFMGDDTTSAIGSFEVSRIALVPEPGLGVLAVTLVAVATRIRRRRS